MKRLQWMIVMTLSLPVEHPFRGPAVDELSTRLARKFRAHRQRRQRDGIKAA
jgi:hypothetical protein